MENITIKEKYNKIIASGLLLPKDRISRNGVLYDWESAKATCDKIPGLPMMYNHQNEGMEKPVGHFIDAICLEKRPTSGKWVEVWDKAAEDLKSSEGIPGVYYEADINPDSEYANSVTRGDVRKVSIQIIPEKQVSETTSDGNKYTRAFIKDYVESSIVPSPGFMETNIAVMCESFNIKKLNEAIKIGDKVHSPSGYAKVISINGNKVIVRSNDPTGDFEYDLNQVQKESIETEENQVQKESTEACDDNKEESQTITNNDVTSTLLKDEDKINEELAEDEYGELIENLELIELCEKLIYNNKR